MYTALPNDIVFTPLTSAGGGEGLGGGGEGGTGGGGGNGGGGLGLGGGLGGGGGAGGGAGGVSMRMRLPSPTRMMPLGATAMPLTFVLVWPNCADSAMGLSKKPGVPFPAAVLTYPPGVIMRTRYELVSPTHTLPAASAGAE